MNRRRTNKPPALVRSQPQADFDATGVKPEPEGIVKRAGEKRVDNTNRNERIWQASKHEQVLDISTTERISPEIIRGIIKRMRHKKEAGERYPERNAKIRERYTNGETEESIGKDYHLTKQAISLICVGVVRDRGRGSAP